MSPTPPRPPFFFLGSFLETISKMFVQRKWMTWRTTPFKAVILSYFREAVEHKLQAACSRSNKHSVVSLLAFSARLVLLQDRLKDMKEEKRDL